MARRPLTAPSFQRDAIPTKNGWRHPKTGELLVSNNFSQAEIDEYMGHDPLEHTHPDGTKHSHEGGDQPHHHHEDGTMHHHEGGDVPHTHDNLEDMSKRQLEALGREHGIELDRRKSKIALIGELNQAGIGIAD
tara:strand:- start:1062 stop:1463 length:402 start_codon:yes stop_codon:yes gene_type:complete